MRAFEISESQIDAVIRDLIADELRWRFRHRVHDTDDAMAILKELSAPQSAAVIVRIAGFFDLTAEHRAEIEAAEPAQWAGLIAQRLYHRNHVFRFTPAGRDSQTEACVHAADLLYAQGAAFSNLLYGRRRLISFVAPHSLMGFTLTVIAPNLQQMAYSDARGMTPAELGEYLTFGDAVVATPSHWRFLLREGVKAPENAMAVTFGEPLSGALSAEMRKCGFGAQREVYGSTESGLVGWRDSAGDAFNLFDFLHAEDGAIMRESARGDRHEIVLMDHVDWEGPRRFRLTGRRDGAVQIGAVNVFPNRIASVIEANQLVERCRVRAGAHPSGFNRLIADIGITGDVQADEFLARHIDQWCRERLHAHERPRIYNFYRL